MGMKEVANKYKDSSTSLLHTRIRKLRVALEYYADNKNVTKFVGMRSNYDCQDLDQGKTATEALKNDDRYK